MRRFFGLVELAKFKGFQKVIGPVGFVVFAGFVEFMKFDGFLGLVELVTQRSKGFRGS